MASYLISQTKRFKKAGGRIYREAYWYLRRLRFRNLQKEDLGNISQNLHPCRDINSVLKSESEIEYCIDCLHSLKLNIRRDKSKNWDAYRAFSFVLRYGNRTSSILDIGSRYGTILPWLSSYGFSNLFGCDITYEEDFSQGNIHYKKQDLECTDFDSNYFDLITSLSVIEHGVDLNRYFFEMHRILKPNGYLLTSTDYWPYTIDTKGLYPYGKEFGEMKIFSKPEIEQLILIAKANGLCLIEDMNFSYQDKVVHWERLDRRFSYIFMVMQNDESKN